MAGHVVKMCNSSSTAPVEHRRHILCSLGGRTGFIILSVQSLSSLQLSLSSLQLSLRPVPACGWQS